MHGAPLLAGAAATGASPFLKTFEQFDFGFQPSIDEKQIRELRTLRFVHEASNVILLGPPGVGKTHLERGPGRNRDPVWIRRVLHDRARSGHRSGPSVREGRLDRRMRVYLAPKVLIIDEMGYLPLDDLGATIFFQLVSARYETWQHHPDFQQELRRLGIDLWRSDHRDRDSRSAAAPFHHHQHPRRELRFKERRKAGLIPLPEQQQAEPTLSWLTAAVIRGASFHEFSEASAIYRPVGI